MYSQVKDWTWFRCLRSQWDQNKHILRGIHGIHSDWPSTHPSSLNQGPWGLSRGPTLCDFHLLSFPLAAYLNARLERIRSFYNHQPRLLFKWFLSIWTQMIKHEPKVSPGAAPLFWTQKWGQAREVWGATTVSVWHSHLHGFTLELPLCSECNGAGGTNVGSSMVLPHFISRCPHSQVKSWIGLFKGLLRGFRASLLDKLPEDRNEEVKDWCD